MKTAEEVRERLEAMEIAKQMLLFPVQEFIARGADPDSLQETKSYATLESLNAEIAALAWVLSEVAK